MCPRRGYAYIVGIIDPWSRRLLDWAAHHFAIGRKLCFGDRHSGGHSINQQLRLEVRNCYCSYRTSLDTDRVDTWRAVRKSLHASGAPGPPPRADPPPAARNAQRHDAGSSLQIRRRRLRDQFLAGQLADHRLRQAGPDLDPHRQLDGGQVIAQELTQFLAGPEFARPQRHEG